LSALLLVDRLDGLDAAIATIVVQRPDMQGRPIWPWMAWLLP
jgi:hypothetical protein